jgi:hypothetical protein
MISRDTVRLFSRMIRGALSGGENPDSIPNFPVGIEIEEADFEVCPGVLHQNPGDQEASPEGLHDLLRYDEVKEVMDPGPGIVKPVHYAVTGDKTGRSRGAHGEYQGPSRCSGSVMNGTDRPCSVGDLSADKHDLILCRVEGTIESPGE